MPGYRQPVRRRFPAKSTRQGPGTALPPSRPDGYRSLTAHRSEVSPAQAGRYPCPQAPGRPVHPGPGPCRSARPAVRYTLRSVKTGTARRRPECQAHDRRSHLPLRRGSPRRPPRRQPRAKSPKTRAAHRLTTDACREVLRLHAPAAAPATHPRRAAVRPPRRCCRLCRAQPARALLRLPAGRTDGRPASLPAPRAVRQADALPARRRRAAPAAAE